MLTNRIEKLDVNNSILDTAISYLLNNVRIVVKTISVHFQFRNMVAITEKIVINKNC